jgi:RND family efflux transporter MFP subunit
LAIIRIGAATTARNFVHLGLLAAGSLVTGLLVAGCGQAPEPRRGPATIEVKVTTPVTDSVADYQDFTGRLSAIKTVEVRARVSGYVLTVPFKEGDLVHAGELLFDIDPFTYAADLSQAQANLKLAQADVTLQQKLANRAQDLLARKAMAQEDYEIAFATWEKSKANVKAQEAARAKAQMYVDYTKVYAPLTGRISFRNVDPGNLVVADTTIMTTIVSEGPLYAYFDLDERTFQDLATSAVVGQTAWFSKLQFPVLMRLATEDDFKTVGTVDFIDNRVNASTGTIRMRGVFKNTERLLRSGLFVRIRLPIGNPYKALLVPDEAVQSDQGRKFLFVVDATGEVVYRPVKLGQALSGMRVIKEGLTEGEHVIVSGMQRVRQGAKVKAELVPPPKPPGSPLGKLLARHQAGNAAPRGAAAQ